ncbi:MAG: hypothetical protein AAFP69_23025 [Planctomycetota bacterium]
MLLIGVMSFSDSASAVAQRPGQSGFAIGSPDRSQQKKQEITTVVYSIADLLQLLAGSSGTTQSTRGGMGGMEYDMGGGLSDMGGGMGMMGGMGGMGDNTPKRTSAKRGGSGGAVTIVNLLTDHVLPQSASDSQMMISIFNDSKVEFTLGSRRSVAWSVFSSVATFCCIGFVALTAK